MKADKEEGEEGGAFPEEEEEVEVIGPNDAEHGGGEEAEENEEGRETFVFGEVSAGVEMDAATEEEDDDTEPRGEGGHAKGEIDAERGCPRE